MKSTRLTPEQFSQIFKRGERVYVASNNVDMHNNNYVRRIFLTAIQGAWHPYVCVHEDYEDEFLAGGAFETEMWHDIKSEDEYKPLTQEQKEIERLRERVVVLESIIERNAEIDWQ